MVQILRLQLIGLLIRAGCSNAIHCEPNRLVPDPDENFTYVPSIYDMTVPKDDRFVRGREYKWPAVPQIKLPVTPQRSSGLKIIGVGILGRTGSESLEVALRALGYTTCGHDGIFMCDKHNATVAKIWENLTAGKTSDPSIALETLLERGIDATIGHAPQGKLWAYYAMKYPKAKFIVSVHPGGGKAWMKSEEKDRIMSQVGLKPEQKALHCKDNRVPFNESFARQMELYYTMKHQYQMSHVPADAQVLVFNASQGWEPLCSFLGRPVPHMPFPQIDCDEARWKDFVANPEKFKDLCPKPAPPFPPDDFFSYWKKKLAMEDR